MHRPQVVDCHVKVTPSIPRAATSNPSGRFADAMAARVPAPEDVEAHVTQFALDHAHVCMAQTELKNRV
ncbi:MAG: hypothetical protein ACYDBA_13785 [Sulfuricaulis sp.]